MQLLLSSYTQTVLKNIFSTLKMYQNQKAFIYTITKNTESNLQLYMRSRKLDIAPLWCVYYKQHHSCINEPHPLFSSHVFVTLLLLSYVPYYQWHIYILEALMIELFYCLLAFCN